MAPDVRRWVGGRAEDGVPSAQGGKRHRPSRADGRDEPPDRDGTGRAGQGGRPNRETRREPARQRTFRFTDSLRATALATGVLTA
ncbi:hypothetical protein ACFPA8_20675 [Streptomyces ovatisporus]|uniref:Uncharacterized protein n=1 Tax=Streptomyces ovatisporus TaxID=1128682 RepID=A0ABV9AC80_9ACTN